MLQAGKFNSLSFSCWNSLPEKVIYANNLQKIFVKRLFDLTLLELTRHIFLFINQ